ncbi:MAG: AgmX/PglI C-terminal domain-containing protein [Polyangiaceae bacterium]
MTSARRLTLGLSLLAAACGGSSTPEPAQPARVSKAHAPAKAPKRTAYLDSAEVVLGLRGHEMELHECFTLAGEQSAGFVELEWDVDPDGIVGDVRVARATASSQALPPCLSERLSQARFGRPGHASVARWTFVGGLVRFEDAETRRRNRINQKRKNKQANDSETAIVIERESPGKLDFSTVEGIVHDGYRLFAHCYRDGLDRDSTLGGAVRLRFVIGADGRVARVVDGGSDIPDEGVVACVAEGFFALQFPKPAGGNVHLRYRMHFDSG